MTSIQIPSIEFSDNRIKKCSVVIDKNSFNVEYKKGKYVVTKGGVTSSKTETPEAPEVAKPEVAKPEVAKPETKTPEVAKATKKTEKPLAPAPARSTPFNPDKLKLNPDKLKLNLKNAFTPSLMEELRKNSKFKDRQGKEGNQVKP